jgi:hypothetical protein
MCLKSLNFSFPKTIIFIQVSELVCAAGRDAYHLSPSSAEVENE